MSNSSGIVVPTPKIGIKGEFQVIVKNADTGEVRFDSGFQENLITDWGIDRFGGYNHYSQEGYGSSYQTYNGKTYQYVKGGSLGSYCQLGSGNKQPENSDTALQSFVVEVSGSLYNNGHIHLSATKEHAFYTTYKYVFNRVINNQNIAEIGLSPREQQSQFKGLFTRALIKNQLGQPTVLSVKSNEVLEVYYRIWLVVSTEKTSHSITVEHTSSSGEQTQKQVAVDVYISAYNRGNLNDIFLGAVRNHSYSSYAGAYITDGEYSRETDNIVSSVVRSSSTEYFVNGINQSSQLNPHVRVPEDSYQLGSKKQVGRLFIDYGHKKSNHSAITSPNIRRIDIPCTVGDFVFIFNDNGTDKGIPKTNNDTLEFVFETSWDRYTGDTSKLVV